MHVPSVKLKGKLGENIMFNGIHPTALRPNQETWIAIIQGALPWGFFFFFKFRLVFFLPFFLQFSIFWGYVCCVTARGQARRQPAPDGAAAESGEMDCGQSECGICAHLCLQTLPACVWLGALLFSLCRSCTIGMLDRGHSRCAKCAAFRRRCYSLLACRGDTHCTFDTFTCQMFSCHGTLCV